MLLNSLAAALIALPVKASFIDDHFGPFGDIEGALVHQANSRDPDDDFERGVIHFPSRDFIDDLNEGPLYTGIATFAHLPLIDCYDKNAEYDIAVLGAPFDTATTYRPGARFGPGGIREGGRRLSSFDYSVYHPDNNPFERSIVAECGDVGMEPFDNRLALDKLYRAHRSILSHRNESHTPKIVTLGGDHTITFSALRAAYEVHGPISVIHFDSHIDTWDPQVLGGNVSSYAHLNHGTFLHYAHEKGYLNHNSLHVGIRAPFVRASGDPENDERCGFKRILARDIDEVGIKGVVSQIKKTIGTNKVYLTVDIDVLDPAYAPGTGTAEPGGYTTRELLSILDGLKGLDFVGADVVEVSPPYDTNGQITVLAAAEIINSFLYILE